MTSPAHHIQYSWEEYLALEATSNVRHEFLEGQIYGMAGSTPEHAALKAAVIGLLFTQIRGGRCRAHDADLRVRVLETGLATYPDVTVICGASERDPSDENAVTNPTLLVEVLSRSTEDYDRIAGLQQYVLVSHREREIEVWSRTPNNEFTRVVARAGGRVGLESIGAELAVDDVYDAAAEPK